MDRLELLGGTILAGNNGVKNEFSKIAHTLNKLGVLNNTQLNNLLKEYIMLPIIIMQERAVHISSVDRQKIGKNKPEDFIIKLDTVLKLQNSMTHEIALDKVTMTYSWHNISDQYQNNEIIYRFSQG